jgi:hypothetical protein
VHRILSDVDFGLDAFRDPERSGENKKPAPSADPPADVESLTVYDFASLFYDTHKYPAPHSVGAESLVWRQSPLYFRDTPGFNPLPSR